MGRYNLSALDLEDDRLAVGVASDEEESGLLLAPNEIDNIVQFET